MAKALGLQADADPEPRYDADWSKNPIDRFIYSAVSGWLEAHGLIVRLDSSRYFDLTGLPPSAGTAIENDRDPKAFEKVVDNYRIARTLDRTGWIVRFRNVPMNAMVPSQRLVPRLCHQVIQ